MAMKECNICFASVNEKESTCPHCGASMKDCKSTTIPQTKNPIKMTSKKTECSTCFASIDVNATKCPHCGTPRKTINTEKTSSNWGSDRTSLYMRHKSVSSVLTGSFWLGFFLGLLGLWITIFGVQDMESIKNAAKGTLASTLMVVGFYILLILGLGAALAG